MKRKGDNRGFTLVELVIAVAILAIAVTPLVANFIQSSKLNLKGRRSLNAMNLAQDVMEGMSAYSATELDKVITTASGNSLTQKILPSNSTYTSATKNASSTADKFIYDIKKVKLSTGGQHSEYDMKITVDASNGNYTEFNKEDVAQISDIDQFYDAIYRVPDTDVSSAVTSLILKSSRVGKEFADYESHMVRNMNIVIKDEGTGGAHSYAIYVDNVYSVATSQMTALGHTAATNSTTQSSGNISKASPDILPRSVYVYFEGLKSATTAGAESINITNTTGQPITVYLIRTQEKNPAGTYDDAYNNSYKCSVKVESSDAAGNAVDNVDIVTNLRFHLSKDLSNNYRLYKEGTTEKTPEAVELNGVVDSYYSSGRATYTYNGAAVNETMYTKHIYDGYRKEKKNMIYDVTMQIYESGTTNLVATYTGGLSD